MHLHWQLGTGIGKPSLPGSPQPPRFTRERSFIPVARVHLVPAALDTPTYGGAAGEWTSAVPLWVAAGQEQQCVFVRNKGHSHQGDSCLISPATGAPVPGDFPTGTFTGQVSPTQGFLFLGQSSASPSHCSPLTLQSSVPGKVVVPCVALTTSPISIT